MDSLLFFNPYYGDTILASALANKFSKHFKDELVVIASITDEMSEFARDLGAEAVSYKKLGDMVEEGSKMSVPLTKHYKGGTDLFYLYDCDRAVEKRIEALCEEIVKDALELSLKKFYILHYSYAYAKLAQVALKHGLEVYGYCIDELNRLYFVKGDTDLELTSIWNRDYIGDRLSRLVTGENLNREDFANLGGNLNRNGVRLFPTTRSYATNAENWHVDIAVLEHMDQPYHVYCRNTEKQPDFVYGLAPNKSNTFKTITDMIHLIQSSEFIICYDSASFHLAWLTGTPAIVKLKGGFNEEWVPRWLKNSVDYYFIPSNQMYEEEYLAYLTEGLNQLGVKVT